MYKKCTRSGKEFEVSAADTVFYERMGVPLPSLCPEERLRQRIAFRNFAGLQFRNCSESGSRILSMYGPNAPFPVVSSERWWNSTWDAASFGRDYDPQVPFLTQYQALSASVPREALSASRAENSAFCNFCFDAKDCYLVFGCVRADSCLYGHIVWESESCVDSLYAYRCQWCSNSVDIVACYDLHYSTESVNCSESWFLHDCRSCRNCFGCWNLRGKQYCVFNKQLSKADYERTLLSMFPLSGSKVDEVQEKMAQIRRERSVYPPLFSSSTEEVSGNHLYFSHHLQQCFDAKNSENSSYCYTVFDVQGSMDLSFGSGRNCYQGLALINAEEVIASHMVNDSANIAYSEFCHSSNDLLGCIGMRGKRYCILNKEYSKEDYLLLRTKIVASMKERGVWGDFFPQELSPFAYNESTAQEYLPLSEAKARELGYSWSAETKAASPDKASMNAVPEFIEDAGDETSANVYRCQRSGIGYKILQQELAFYRRVKLPLPRIAPAERHAARMALRSGRRTYQRNCTGCSAPLQAAFSLEEAKKLLCEPCYLQSLQ